MQTTISAHRRRLQQDYRNFCKQIKQLTGVIENRKVDYRLCYQLATIVVFIGVGLLPIQAQVFCEQTAASNPFDFIDVGEVSRPQLVDVDGDGNLDLIVGAEDGKVSYYKNDGSGNYTEQTGAANPFDAIIGNPHLPMEEDPPGRRFSSPQLVDVDGDGDLDLILGEDYGRVLYYTNDGSNNYTEQTGASNPFDGMLFQFESTPQLVDLDGDGDLDLMSSSGVEIAYLTNDGSGNYTAQTGTANPFDGIIFLISDVYLVDVDGDVDLDLVIGNINGSLSYYANDGNENYTQQTGIANPFDGINVGQWASPHFADLDGDGDLDLVIGESDGYINYHKNVNMLAVASTATCGANSGEVTINISSTETTGIYSVTGDFTASVGAVGTMGGAATIATGITSAGTYNIVVTSNEGCQVPLEVMMDAACAFGELAVDVKVQLKGPHNGTDMNTTLHMANLIPTTQPYTSIYAGTESVLSIPADVVDWVLVELRSSANTIAATRAAFLKKDGSVVDLDGISAVAFPGVADGSYYVAVRHRNHLGVMTDAPLLFN